ncbi:hypothetical protein CALCODRAFT_193434 [Calocera cornea HHB12733]|uniref:Uncharacterized protein n=1 Tax=Calocera cornea HHB12733 TaxID=1353952 RepID=A0A165C771_9BASI|nr:hypothetical protein CALCODRAFT_193434 [Calocera cornea HHB12733]
MRMRAGPGVSSFLRTRSGLRRTGRSRRGRRRRSRLCLRSWRSGARTGTCSGTGMRRWRREAPRRIPRPSS